MPYIKKMKIEDIVPYENNPRKNDQSVDDVAESIKDFGYLQHIVVDKNNVVIVGHTRLKALKKLGKTEVDVIVADNLNEKQVNAYRIADNKTGEKSLWDDDLLKIELAKLEDVDMTHYGFTDEELSRLLDDDDGETSPGRDVEIPDVPIMAESKRGQIYKLGKHRLMCGDSTNADDMARLMDGIKADITFTSPPYNAHHLDVKKSEARGGGFQKETQKKYLADNDDWTDESYQNFLETNIDLLMENSYEVFYNIGVGSGSKRTIARILNTFADNFKDLLYWKKTNPMPVIADGVISSATELIIAFGHNGTRSFRNFDDDYFHGVIEGQSASATNEYADIHKATFPLYLPTEIITRFTKKNGTVLDCFGGTGTTLIACENTGRTCYMMELEPVYVDVIIKRWEELTGQKAEIVSE